MAAPSPLTSPAAAATEESLQLHSSSPSANNDSSFLSLGSADADPDTSISSVSTAASTATEEKHPKGKRKRTGARDKTVLEEAYNNNPKPDKQARLEIVERVSLSEKEVQIWFQNRRQNDRRKSRPLSPSEIAALRYGGMPGMSCDLAAAAALPENASSDPAISQMLESSPPESSQQQASPSQADPLRSEELSASFAVTASQESGEADLGATSETPSGSQESQTLSQSFPQSSVGYLANRWNIRNSEGETHQQRDQLHRSSFSSNDAVHLKPRSSSSVRLSLSLEGKAELVSNKASPEKPAPLRSSSSSCQPGLPLPIPLPQIQNYPRKTLQRSQSAFSAITLPPISALTGHLPPRLGRGRSRNVHAWESCADSEARDELIDQAENESSGSAVAAITLLRSLSGMQPSSKGNRREAAPAETKGSGATHPAKKAKLSRTASSMARLETLDIPKSAEKDSTSEKVKFGSVLGSPTDSDKENWSPDEDGNPVRHSPRRQAVPNATKPQNPRRTAHVLQDVREPSFLGVNGRSRTAPVGGQGAKGTGKGKGATVEIFEDGDVKEAGSAKRKRGPREEDVEKFMRGEVSPSKKGDMDCVAGLLSLSQGAWR